MEEFQVVCLGLIISAALTCNIVALVFILHKQSSTLKDKTIAILCIINILQTGAYGIEMHAAIQSQISIAACKISALLICSFTYTSIGYFVEIALERYVTMLYFSAEHTDYLSTVLWLLIPPVVRFTFASAPLLGLGKYGKSRDTALYCGFDFRDSGVRAKTYFLIIIVVMVVLPVAIISVCFVNIIRNLQRRRQTKEEEENDEEDGLKCSSKDGRDVQDQLKSFLFSREELLWHFLFTALVYFVSWIPYATVCFMFFYEVQVPLVLEYIATYLSKTCTISTPVLYYFIENHCKNFVRSAEVVVEDKMCVFAMVKHKHIEE